MAGHQAAETAAVAEAEVKAYPVYSGCPFEAAAAVEAQARVEA